jgi:hypothetical protein
LRVAQEYERSYELFLSENQNADLDELVEDYLKTLDDETLTISEEII